MLSFILADVKFHTLSPMTFSVPKGTALPLLTRGVDDAGNHLKTVFISYEHVIARLRHEAQLNRLMTDSGLVEDDDHLRFCSLWGNHSHTGRVQPSFFLPSVNVLPETIDLLTGSSHWPGVAFPPTHDACPTGQPPTTDPLGKVRSQSSFFEQLDAIIAELNHLKNQAGLCHPYTHATPSQTLVQAIPAGIDLCGTIRVNRPEPRDLADVLEAFVSLNISPYLGDLQSRGFGLFNGSICMHDDQGQMLCSMHFGHEPSLCSWTEQGKRFAKGLSTTPMLNDQMVVH